MDKPDLFQEKGLLFEDRLRRLFIGTQLAAVGGILNLAFFGNNLIDRSHSLFFRLDFLALVIGVAITVFFLTKLGRGQDRVVFTAFLWLWTIVMTFTTWFEGGLHSSLILSFPIIFIFIAMFADKGAFLPIGGFLSGAIIYMGLSDFYGWFQPPEEMMLGEVSRFISILVLNSLAGYATWVFGRLLKKSFDELRRENERIIQSQAIINEQAECDASTGLLNRIGASAKYHKQLREIDFNQQFLVAYLIDLDNFKTINDLFDHHIGDQILITMSRRLAALSHQGGIVSRLAGDEFMLIMLVDNGFDAEAFATSIIVSLRQPHNVLGTEAEVTTSIGITLVTNGQLSFIDVCKQADVAMHHAKQSGKNKYHLHSAELERKHMRNLNIVGDLDSALSNNLLDVYYQPKINLKTNKVDSVEALLRWNRGNEEGISTGEFMPVIESTHLIHRIGAWVLKEACSACKTWQQAGLSINVAVNVSALQLTRSDFYQTVVDVLEQNDLPPERLEIEITEHFLISESPVVIKQLEALKRLGIGLAIDDFGTGYSNIAYLTQLKVNVLKLDRCFITQINQNEEHQIIVIAVITMAKALGMKVVAEGVETEAELQALKIMNCDYGQGFLWSPAIPSKELMSLVDGLQGSDPSVLIRSS